MRVGDQRYRSIWEADRRVRIIDQTRLPHEFVTTELTSLAEALEAIRVMRVRGAPLIGATAAYGLALAAEDDASDAGLATAGEALLASRPTAVNLGWAVGRVTATLLDLPEEERSAAAWKAARRICDEDVETNRRIGEHGLRVLQTRFEATDSEALNVLTHCNAGWLATVDWGTALAPIFMAHDAGIPVHVWVDETRPRNQGGLTAWELAQHGVPHTLVVDNAGGHLMRQGMVDLCLVGTDRTTAGGDVCNKIGTYLKALAAKDNDVPFYVALPGSTVDWSLESGDQVPIEERDAAEVACVSGLADDQTVREVRLVPAETPVANPAFDVTPARLVTGLVTERGVAEASRDGLMRLFPERTEQPRRRPTTPAR